MFFLISYLLKLLVFHLADFEKLFNFIKMNVIPDPEDIGKLFVGGLSSSTTKENLRSYFNQFGEVVDSVVMKNNETGRSRGFGFVTFKDPNCTYKTLQVKNHELDGKKIDPKECTPRSMQKARKQAGRCKIFLGGLPPDITEDAIRKGMSKFGKVDQVIIMIDQETKKCRGFGFLSFELEESIEQACAERFVVINGKQIECKRAEPRINAKRSMFFQNFLKNQNGFVGQSPYGHITSVQQSNWNMPSTQSLYSMQGSTYVNYQNATVVPFNSSHSGFSNVQSLPYTQPYQQSYGSYNYTQIPTNTYTQPVFVTNSYTSDSTTSAAVTTVDTGKSYGSSDYSQNASSYGPIKATFVGVNATDVTHSSPVMVSSTNYQRYHPYKV